MNENESIPSAAPEQTVRYVPVRRLRRTHLLIGVAGLAVGAIVATGCTLAIESGVGAHQTAAAVQVEPATAGQSGASGSAFGAANGSGSASGRGYGSGSGYGYGRYGGRSGSGSSGSGSSGSSGSSNGLGAAGTGSAAATADEEIGVVLVESTLSYESAEAEGTGMVVTSSGEIVTNNHVVEGATSITVVVAASGATYTATVVGTDATDDVAVLQLQGASGLQLADFGDSDELGTGDAVVGVGNAEGGGELLAAPGSVVALGQSITTEAEGPDLSESLSGLIETDADVVSGDSGGPLYDAAGAIVGMDTAASENGEAQSYAIPIATALSIAGEIETGDSSGGIQQGTPAFLGVELGQDGGGTGAGGAQLAGVVDGTPAAGAGLEAGDLVTALDGSAVESGSDLSAALAQHEPGDQVTIEWTDVSGASHTATVTLVAGPAA